MYVCMYVRMSDDDWNSSLAQSSHLHWPAELRGVRPRNLEVYLLRYAPRTVTEHLQAPAEDSSTCEPSSGAVVTDQPVRRRIQIFRRNSTQLLEALTYKVYFRTSRLYLHVIRIKLVY